MSNEYAWAGVKEAYRQTQFKSLSDCLKQIQPDPLCRPILSMRAVGVRKSHSISLLLAATGLLLATNAFAVSGRMLTLEELVSVATDVAEVKIERKEAGYAPAREYCGTRYQGKVVTVLKGDSKKQRVEFGRSPDLRVGRTYLLFLLPGDLQLLPHEKRMMDEDKTTNLPNFYECEGVGRLNFFNTLAVFEVRSDRLLSSRSRVPGLPKTLRSSEGVRYYHRGRLHSEIRRIVGGE